MAQTQQGARPEETAGGCPGALHPPAQVLAVLLHAVHSKLGCELGALDMLQACWMSGKQLISCSCVTARITCSWLVISPK